MRTPVTQDPNILKTISRILSLPVVSILDTDSLESKTVTHMQSVMQHCLDMATNTQEQLQVMGVIVSMAVDNSTVFDFTLLQRRPPKTGELIPDDMYLYNALIGAFKCIHSQEQLAHGNNTGVLTPNSGPEILLRVFDAIEKIQGELSPTMAHRRQITMEIAKGVNDAQN